MNTPENPDDIVSSTGSLGIHERSYGRLYHNNATPVEQVSQLTDDIARLQSMAESRPDISRIVIRGVMNQEVYEQIDGSDVKQYLEVLAPLDAHGYPDQYLYYVAQNYPGRDTIRPIEEMIENTNVSLALPQTRSLTATLSDHTLTGADAPRLLELWGHTFEWKEDQIDAFITRINHNKQDVWFSGQRGQDGQLASASMAERLDLPTCTGSIALIESTEWRTHPDRTGQGLMTRTLMDLNAQVIQDLAGINPFIFAECNYQSRSDVAARRAGFEIPCRRLATQIVRQNVVVEDDTGLPLKTLRDFTLLTLPANWR